MVRPLTIHAGEHVWSSIPLSISLFVSATILVALCANHARKVSRNKHHAETNDPKATPKKVMETIGIKSLPLINNKKKNNGGDQECEEATNKSRSHERFGEGTGLWQKAILMGEKCQPPEFSGVIYYDSRGNRVSELPRSPRTPPRTPRPYNSSSFTNFAVSRDVN